MVPILTLKLEGFGTINTWSILVNGIEVSSTADPVPVNVLPADEITINVNIMNSDTKIVPDFIYGEFVSVDVTPREALIQWSAKKVRKNRSMDVQWTFTMPYINADIVINAGHEE